MINLRRIVALVLVVVTIFSLGACQDSNDASSDVVMSYGNSTLSEGEYKYIAAYVKDNVVYSQQNYYYQYTGQLYEEADILKMPVDSERTVEEYIKDYSMELAQQMLIIEELCREANIEITEQEDLNAVNDYIHNIQDAFGGEDLFEIKLTELGFAKSGIERYQKLDVLFGLLYEDRYGENGTARIPEETVKKYFTDNYIRYDGAMYSYYNTSDSTKITYEFSDDEITNYFNEHFVKVRHILYLTEKLSDEEVAKKKAAAEAAYQSISSGEKTFDDYVKDNEDSGSEYLFTYGKMVDAFETAAFDMAVGDVRLVKTEYGYHIIEKLEKTLDDLNGVADENGKPKGGAKSDVIAALSAKKIRDEALVVLEKLNNGELTSYPKENEDSDNYIVMEEAYLSKNDANNTYFINVITTGKKDVYFEHEINGSATYILRNLSFTADDITSDIYSEIEETISMENFSEYVKTFYDSVVIEQDKIDAMKIAEIPLLEEEFYVNYK